jgi:hypothetical protein
MFAGNEHMEGDVHQEGGQNQTVCTNGARLIPCRNLGAHGGFEGGSQRGSPSIHQGGLQS